ncbi:hypothetical protein GCM10010341_57940 [Streptomyces noursei]|nr:hypothetical protein GCM10010341_57940 [Streptomyces noursei]
MKSPRRPLGQAAAAERKGDRMATRSSRAAQDSSTDIVSRYRLPAQLPRCTGGADGGPAPLGSVADPDGTVTVRVGVGAPVRGGG